MNIRKEYREYLHGFQLGMIALLPILLAAEQIRYGFISNWVPLWLPIILVGIVLLLIDTAIAYVMRFTFFIEYSIVSILLLMRITDNDFIFFIGAFGFVLTWFFIFSVAQRSKISEHTHV